MLFTTFQKDTPLVKIRAKIQVPMISLLFPTSHKTTRKTKSRLHSSQGSRTSPSSARQTKQCRSSTSVIGVEWRFHRTDYGVRGHRERSLRPCRYVKNWIQFLNKIAKLVILRPCHTVPRKAEFEVIRTETILTKKWYKADADQTRWINFWCNIRFEGNWWGMHALTKRYKFWILNTNKRINIQG